MSYWWVYPVGFASLASLGLWLLSALAIPVFALVLYWPDLRRRPGFGPAWRGLGVLAAGLLVVTLVGVWLPSHNSEVRNEQAQQLRRSGRSKWYAGNYTEADQDLTQAIELRPEWDAEWTPPYMNRALVRVALGEYELALNDANRAEQVYRGSALDARAYVYLKSGRPREALADYDEADRRVGGYRLQFPRHLLGRGLALAALGESARAVADLEAGLRPADDSLEISSLQPIIGQAPSNPDPLYLDLVAEARRLLGPSQPYSTDNPSPGIAPGDASWPCAVGQIKVNRSIYYVPGGEFYARTYANSFCLNTEEEAQAAGFRRSAR
jgi:tetratricopeptide (TPR) repeat protein